MEKRLMFAWCNDKFHDKCKASFKFYDQEIVCGCECHKEK